MFSEKNILSSDELELIDIEEALIVDLRSHIHLNEIWPSDSKELIKKYAGIRLQMDKDLI